jgi:hypothetical protein
MATNHVLLLGAGFTRNWDGPLASEMAASVIQEVGDDRYLQELLRRHDRNYEDALSEVQRAAISSPSSAELQQQLERLQGAISNVFLRLNGGFERRTEFEFCNDLHFSVAKFLARFEAIFSLNQDLLLELRYEQHVLIASGTRWGGFQRPGIRAIHDPSITGIGDNHRRRWAPAPAPFIIEPRLQPYFKLHGSSNWFVNGARQLLVMGGNKDLVIREHEVLNWYYDQFQAWLSVPNTRLMVIGYSFSDRHINDVIVEARRNGSLTGMFLADPGGRAILNPTSDHAISQHSDLDPIPSLGASVRPIREVFSGDAFEHAKFINFFRPS